MTSRIYYIILYIIALIAGTFIYFYLLPQFIKDGGYLIILMLSLSIVLLGTIIERLLVFRYLFDSGKTQKTNFDYPIPISGRLNIELEQEGKSEKSDVDVFWIKYKNDAERHLPIISTIASISTLIGLLGTTIGMIRAFTALSQTGAPDAVQLSLGISEALVNTAGGLILAILAIIAFNYFSGRLDHIENAVRMAFKHHTGSDNPEHP